MPSRPLRGRDGNLNKRGDEVKRAGQIIKTCLYNCIAYGVLALKFQLKRAFIENALCDFIISLSNWAKLNTHDISQLVTKITVTKRRAKAEP